MNTIITSRDAILKSSREIIRAKGFPALSIRSVASEAGISVGSIYNYFPSKSALVGAAVESIWMDIFHHCSAEPFRNIEKCIAWIFECLKYGSTQYPGFMQEHAAAFSPDQKAEGLLAMEKVWNHVIGRISTVLKTDPQIRENAFTGEYTPERFARMLFSLILSAALHGAYDPYMILETVRRALY